MSLSGSIIETASHGVHEMNNINTFQVVELMCSLVVAGVLSLLSESEEEIKIFALRRLDQLVDNFWAEISESVTSM